MVSPATVEAVAGNQWRYALVAVQAGEEEEAPPPSKEGGFPTLPNFGGSFIFMHTHLDAELPNFTYVYRACY